MFLEEYLAQFCEKLPSDLEVEDWFLGNCRSIVWIISMFPSFVHVWLIYFVDDQEALVWSSQTYGLNPQLRCDAEHRASILVWHLTHYNHVYHHYLWFNYFASRLGPVWSLVCRGDWHPTAWQGSRKRNMPGVFLKHILTDKYWLQHILYFKFASLTCGPHSQNLGVDEGTRECSVLRRSFTESWRWLCVCALAHVSDRSQTKKKNG